jgi:hypothetical protein
VDPEGAVSRAARGSALMNVVIMMGILAMITVAVLSFSGQERKRAIQKTRTFPKNYCSETGLQMARAYFGSNFKNWNTYLGAPGEYDPVKSSCNTAPANPGTVSGRAAIAALHPELLADLDGDGRADVYIYMRDNADEAAATNNCKRDNDLQVIVGAVCVSGTLGPRRDDGTVDQSGVTLEGELQYNPPSGGYAQRCGANGNCNSN